MNRDEVLKKYREEGVDEGRDEVNKRGDNDGFYGLCILGIVVMVYQTWRNQPFGDVAALLFVFLSVGGFSRYKSERCGFHLLLGIGSGILCLLCLGWYVWKTI